MISIFFDLIEYPTLGWTGASTGSVQSVGSMPETVLPPMFRSSLQGSSLADSPINRSTVRIVVYDRFAARR
jgi:hypothetical protein